MAPSTLSNPPAKQETEDWVVEVACIGEFSELHSDDIDAHGNCTVDGMWKLSSSEAVSEDAILDSFHAQVPIANLEDFSITVRRTTEHDCPEDYRGNLGLIDLNRDGGPHLGM